MAANVIQMGELVVGEGPVDILFPVGDPPAPGLVNTLEFRRYDDGGWTAGGVVTDIGNGIYKSTLPAAAIDRVGALAVRITDGAEVTFLFYDRTQETPNLLALIATQRILSRITPLLDEMEASLLKSLRQEGHLTRVDAKKQRPNG